MNDDEITEWIRGKLVEIARRQGMSQEDQDRIMAGTLTLIPAGGWL